MTNYEKNNNIAYHEVDLKSVSFLIEQIAFYFFRLDFYSSLRLKMSKGFVCKDLKFYLYGCPWTILKTTIAFKNLIILYLFPCPLT